MKVVIDIPEEKYDGLMKQMQLDRNFSACEITPLPKGCGNLIDADALIKKMEEREEQLKDDRSMWETAAVETALDMFAPIIIPADNDKEREEYER